MVLGGPTGALLPVTDPLGSAEGNASFQAKQQPPEEPGVAHSLQGTPEQWHPLEMQNLNLSEPSCQAGPEGQQIVPVLEPQMICDGMD